MNEIDDLLDRIPTPPADVAADVARGERALHRRRRWQAGAASLAVVAVTSAGVALTGGGGTPQAGFSAQPSQSAGTHQAQQKSALKHAVKQHAATQREAVKLLKRQARLLQHQANVNFDSPTLQAYHDVLAEHLDPTGQLLRLAQNVQSGSGTYGTKLDWNHGGMLEISLSTSWRTSDWNAYAPGPGERLTYDGHQARVLVDGSDIRVAVQHDDGEVVMLLASTAFGNNGTSTATLGLTQDQLLAAAADSRLQLPSSMR